MSDQLPFNLVAEDILSEEDIKRLEKMQANVFEEFGKLSIEEMRQSPKFREIEHVMKMVAATFPSDIYYTVNRLTVDTTGNITIYSYYAYLGDGSDKDILDELGILGLSPESIHVVIPTHAFDGSIFNSIMNVDHGVAITCEHGMFYPTSLKDEHPLVQLERNPEMLNAISNERAARLEELSAGRGATTPFNF